MEKENVLEAMLFMSVKPISKERLMKKLKVSSEEFEKLIEILKNRYKNTSMEIAFTSEGYSLHLKKDYLEHVKHLTPYYDMKPGHKKCLAFVAYKEPVTQAHVVKVMGNRAYSYLKFLEKKGLVRGEKKRKTKVYRLTREFERYFGMSKEEIKERMLEMMRKETKEI